MKIENLVVTVRPRQAWEAGDLGLVMVRHWWRQIYPPFLALVIPLAFLAFGLLKPGLAVLFLWWLKPLYARLPLFILAQNMFGAKMSLKDSFRALMKTGVAGLLGQLTLFRLSPLRNVLLPVYLLEGVSGAARSKRLSQLRHHLISNGFTMTLVMLLFEWVVLFGGLVAAVYMFIPESLIGDVAEIQDTEAWNWTMNLAYVVAFCIIEPIYVAVSFALYLNTRTILEGWDIELKFRSMAQRLGKHVATTLLLFSCVMGLSSQPGLMAQEDVAATEEQRVEDALKAAIEDPRFTIPSKTEESWQLRDAFSSDESVSRSMNLDGVGGILAQFFEVLIYAFLVFALIAVIIVVIRLLPENRPASEGKVHAEAIVEYQSTLTQLIGEEPLPEDIVNAAREAWQNHEMRKALSYLYRGALRALHQGERLSIDDCATEAEVLSRVIQLNDEPLSTYFGNLTKHWQRVAYGHRHLESEIFDALLNQWSTQMESQS